MKARVLYLFGRDEGVYPGFSIPSLLTLRCDNGAHLRDAFHNGMTGEKQYVKSPEVVQYNSAIERRITHYCTVELEQDAAPDERRTYLDELGHELSVRTR